MSSRSRRKTFSYEWKPLSTPARIKALRVLPDALRELLAWYVFCCISALGRGQPARLVPFFAFLRRSRVRGPAPRARCRLLIFR